MTGRLSNQTALITGGGSGIGHSVCKRLATEGAEVLVLDLDLTAAESTAAEICTSGGNARAFQCDVANRQTVETVIAKILTTSKIDILINNAGIGLVGNLENTSEEDFDRLYQVNVKGIFNMLAMVIPGMKAQRHGVIVNLASIAASVGIEDRFAYSMTKGAVLTMTYSIARDYIDHGIRCNCISPGRVHTPFVDAYLDKNYPDNRAEMFDQLSKSQPIGRMAQADEIAGMIAYLCSDEASFITGSNMPIDGGFVTLNN